MAAVQVTSGVYFIQNTGTSTVLELVGGSATDGTKVQGYAKRQFSDELVPSQLWVISQLGADLVYTIQNTNSRTFADLTGGNVANQTPIIGSKGTGEANQHWIFIQNADKTAYFIKNQASGTYVDLLNGGASNGTAVNGWGLGSATNTHQLWHLVRA
ncbi:ricin B-like lectin [Irpex rosettiformis]|uniref:Ricin B-like lectin n=1 Tax=Irpex rosettiformis TaxID=378272 RepID=A0ACB8U8I0_9APHY|nr:ricin B-like lectin [Irpex rosettiformis]